MLYSDSLNGSSVPSFSSYLYLSEGCQSYLFSISECTKENCSFIPSFKINGKKVFFTFNGKHVLDCENELIYSFEELIKKIGLPKDLNQEELDKIAIIVNYLSQGQSYTYIHQTAKQEEGKKFTFSVSKDTHLYHVSLSSFKDRKVYYQLA